MAQSETSPHLQGECAEKLVRGFSRYRKYSLGAELRRGCAVDAAARLKIDPDDVVGVFFETGTCAAPIPFRAQS